MLGHGDIEAGEIKPMEHHISKFGQDATMSKEVGKLVPGDRRTKRLTETVSNIGRTYTLTRKPNQWQDCIGKARQWIMLVTLQVIV